MRPGLIDTHCHLTFGDLGKQAEAALVRARDAGVSEIILIGIDAASSKEVADFAARHDGLHAAAGIHPNSVSEVGENEWDDVAEMIRSGRVVAVGETGIDLYWDRAPLTDQIDSLERHAEAALAEDLPVVIHVRDAFPRLREVLRPFGPRGLRGVIHCFGGEREDIHPFVDWGWAISFAGNLTYPKAEGIRAAAERTPLEQCLIETDAPWLAPVPRRGRLNEPALIVHTAERLAEVKGVSFEEVAEATTRNARALFRLP